MKNILYLVSVIAIAILFHNCGRECANPRISIALSKGSPDSLYANYYKWIESHDSTVKCIDLYALPIDSAIKRFRGCSGLILTGGTDIHPGFYDKAYDTVRCWPVDDHRDQLEMMLLDSALAWGMPVLGICRGHQMLNVALGGSLIVDIPEDFNTTLQHQCEDYLSCYHSVVVDTSSLLFEIAQCRDGEVTSNHHQAVYEVAPALRISVHATDGIAEALEWKDRANRSFLLGVQWHPERMQAQNPFSNNIARKFLEESYFYGRRSAVGGRRSAVGDDPFSF